MIPLESVNIAFDIWRAAKTNTNTPVPAELWDMVRQILPVHKKSEICKVLRISGNQIKQHCAATPISKVQELQPLQSIGNDFIEAIPASNAGMSELTLKGNSKSLHLYLPTTALREVLPMLGELL